MRRELALPSLWFAAGVIAATIFGAALNVLVIDATVANPRRSLDVDLFIGIGASPIMAAFLTAPLAIWFAARTRFSPRMRPASGWRALAAGAVTLLAWFLIEEAMSRVAPEQMNWLGLLCNILPPLPAAELLLRLGKLLPLPTDCPACGYDLRGTPGSKTCPECGADSWGRGGQT